PGPSAIARPSYPNPSLLHAAAAQVVLVEAFQMPDLVQQRVADLLGQLDPRLDRAREVLAIQDDRRRLVIRRRRAPDRPAIQAEDRGRERRVDRLQILRQWEVLDLDLDLLDPRAPLGRQRR